MKKTLSRAEFNQRLSIAREAPGLAHLPSFGLLAPRTWDYQDVGLLQRAKEILTKAGIEGVPVVVAPALFWYENPQGERHLHHWED